jgi:hypothetical protein
MKITFVRKGRNWINNQNGKKEEVLDVFQEGNTHRHYRGMCNESFIMLTGINLEPLESVTLEINKVS